MRYLVGAVLVLLYSMACAAPAAEFVVTTEPPGAAVWVAPPDQPCLYSKGTTPCTLSLPQTAAPYRLILRAPGYFDAHRSLSGPSAALNVTLLSRSEPANWRLVPALWQDGGLWSAAWAAARRRLSGIPEYPNVKASWAPDAQGLLVFGNAWSMYVSALGFGKRDEDREPADLWYAPLQGVPVRLWHCLSGPEGGPRFEMDARFGPDGRWVVHSAPDGEVEHIELECLTTGQKRAVARDPKATLYCPVLSANGRRLACLRMPTGARADDGPEDPPAELLVMQWDGSDRRTLLRAVSAHFEPTFSPDGTKLAYLTPSQAVAVIPVGGGKPRIIIAAGTWRASDSPVWSRDGRSLAVDAEHLDDRGDAERNVQRILWARVDGGASGEMPAVALHGWHDSDSLDVYAPSYCAAAGVRYQRLLWVGLDGVAKRVLYEPQTLFHHAAMSADATQVVALECAPSGPQTVVLANVSDKSLRRFSDPRLAAATDLGWLDREQLWVSVAASPTGPPAYRLDITTGTVTPIAERPKRPPSDPFSEGLSARADDTGTLRLFQAGGGPFGAGQVLSPGGWFDSLAPTIPAGGEAR